MSNWAVICIERHTPIYKRLGVYETVQCSDIIFEGSYFKCEDFLENFKDETGDMTKVIMARIWKKQYEQGKH